MHMQTVIRAQAHHSTRAVHQLAAVHITLQVHVLQQHDLGPNLHAASHMCADGCRCVFVCVMC